MPHCSFYQFVSTGNNHPLTCPEVIKSGLKSWYCLLSFKPCCFSAEEVLHTWSFAQNSFQIDSINSGCTSKKLEFWLKIVKVTYLLTQKLIKGTLGLILEIMKKIARWRHKSEISKRNVKTMISALLFHL